MQQVDEVFEEYINEDSYFTEHGKQPSIPLERLHKFKSILVEDLYNEIEDLVLAASSMAEKQGFINGFTYTYKKD